MLIWGNSKVNSSAALFELQRHKREFNAFVPFVVKYF